MSPAKSNINQVWLYPSFVWLIQLLMAVLIANIFSHIFPIFPSFPKLQNYPMFFDWDAGYYLKIAEHGYWSIQSTAFYPLYPLLIHGLVLITHLSYHSSAFWIANLSLWLALIFLYQLILTEHEIRIAKLTLWLITAFPAAMFFNCAYTESINLLCLVLFFYFLQRDQWYLALLAGCFAAITHGFGLLLIFSGLAFLWTKRTQLKSSTLILRIISLLLIIPLGVLLYMIFLYAITGSPFTSFYAHRFWDHQSIKPVIHIITFLGHMWLNPGYDSPFKIIETIHGIFSLIMVLMGILMLVIYPKHFNLPIKVFYIVSVIMSISSGPSGQVDSFSRYVLVLFPGFIVWAYICKQREFLFITSLWIMLPLKTILMGMFADGYWIT